MKKIILLYFPFALSENPKSGSQLRPVKIIKAFEEFGFQENKEIVLIAGSSSERAFKWQEFLKRKVLHYVEYCYSENQTIPLWLTDKKHIPKRPFIDYQVFHTLKRHEIPIGLFYRDVYWKFDDLYPLIGWKKSVMRLIYRMEEIFYSKYVDNLFLPSDAMGQYVTIDANKIALPPGGTVENDSFHQEKSNTVAQGIYVGGINNPDYGVKELMHAYEELNRDSIRSELTIVCRKEEWDHHRNEFEDLLSLPYFHIKHLHGNALVKLYEQMDFAFIPRKKILYYDFSVPVKLVEYLSHGLPIVATNCDAQMKLITEDQFGVITKDNSADIAEGIEKMIENLTLYQNNVRARFEKNHSWKARIQTLNTCMLGENDENSSISSQ